MPEVDSFASHERNSALPSLSEDRLLASLNRQVFENSSPVIIIVNPVVVLVLAVSLRGEVRPSWLLALFLASLVVVAVNVSIHRNYERNAARDSNPIHWHRLLVLGAALNGAAWGIGLAGVLLDGAGALTIILPLVVAAGFACGYVAAQSASIASVASFMSAAFVPMAGALALRGGDAVVPLILLMALFAASLMHFALNNHRQIVETLTLRFQKDALLADLRATQGDLIEARNTAQGMNRAKSQFLAMMSHELRTPLNAILGFADIVANEQFGPAGQPRYVDYAKDIHASGRHLLALVNDILDLSKVEAGRMEIAPEPIDIADVFRTVSRLQRMNADQAGVDLSIELSPDARTITADHRALAQILFNLVGNAIKFTSQGGSILIGAQSGIDDTVILSVRDNGVGIAPDDIERVLRPFEQADNGYARSKGGTGLGLSLAKALAELHGGSLTLKSTLEEGTLVQIRLPREPK